jgi:hypothetical protein
MPGYRPYGYYPDPEEERRLREMNLLQDPEALAGRAAVRPPPMDLTNDPEALRGSPDWQRFNQDRVEMRAELDNEPPPMMGLTRDPEALNSPMLRQQPAPPPPAAGPSVRGSLAALITPRDQEMDSRWRGAEQQALDRSGYQGDQPYGAGEAVRDFAPMAVGGVLDALLNKGRGLGAIVGGGMQANQIEAARRQKEAQAAGDFALSSRNQREKQGQPELDAAYKQAMMERWLAEDERGRANIQGRNRGLDLRGEKQDYDINANNPEAQRAATIRQSLSGVDVSGMSNKGQGSLSGLLAGNQRFNDAGPIAGAQAQGRIDTELENEPDTTAAAARKETATTLANKAATNPRLDASGNPILPPGIDAAGSGYATLAQRNPEQAAAVAQTEQDIETLRQGQQNLAKIREQIDAIPLRDRTKNNPAFAQLYGQWQTDKGTYQTRLFQAQNRGVPQAFEQKQFDINVGDPQTWEDAATNPVAAGKSALTDQQAMMRGQAEAIGRTQQQFRQKWGFQPPQAQRPAAVGSGPTTGAPGQPFNVPLGAPGYDPKKDNLSDVNPAGDALGVAGSRKNSSLPPIPAQAGTGAPPQPITLRPSGMPDGSFYATDPASGRTKRISKEAAAALGGGQ